LRLPHLEQPVWRAAWPMGLAAAAIVWIVFLVHGGAGGASGEGTIMPLATFLLEALCYFYAGFRVGRGGMAPAQSAIAGAVAGLMAELLAGFWRTALLFLNSGYMSWIQSSDVKFNPAYLQMPWPPLSVLAALVGTVVAGIAVGAAAGAIGGAFAARPETDKR
jgi:hypothetical protein